ncbi:guanine nucleotide-binding 3 [Trifolium pratense]|uniref:Guanine nucleotide-binding 3 n=1 Tax=Trifolium pratense TaxID=57577 RepID=A0A2K3MLH9_TRIPR|nr:guanine nucleotide-binding 3 [Trifolium pratense]
MVLDCPGVVMLKFQENNATVALKNCKKIEKLDEDELRHLAIHIFFKIIHGGEERVKIKKSITIGLVGLPNIGNSSLINSLKRCHVVNVGATPGLTRSMQPPINTLLTASSSSFTDAVRKREGKASANPFR